MLTIVELGFYLMLIIMACSVIVKLAKKQTVDWKSVGARAVAAVVIYALWSGSWRLTVCCCYRQWSWDAWVLFSGSCTAL